MHRQSLSCQLTPTIACKTFHPPSPLSLPAQFTKSDEFLPYAVLRGYLQNASTRTVFPSKMVEKERRRESIVHSLTDHRAKVMNFYRASPLFHGEEGGREWCRETRPFSSSWQSLAAIHQGRCIFSRDVTGLQKTKGERSSRFKTEPRPNDSSPTFCSPILLFLIRLLKLINSLGLLMRHRGIKRGGKINK